MSQTFCPPFHLLFCFSGWCWHFPGVIGCVPLLLPQTCWGSVKAGSALPSILKILWLFFNHQMHHTSRSRGSSFSNQQQCVDWGHWGRILRRGLNAAIPVCSPCLLQFRFLWQKSCLWGCNGTGNPIRITYSDSSLFPIFSFVPPVGHWVVMFSQPETRIHLQCIIVQWITIYINVYLFLFLYCLV